MSSFSFGFTIGKAKKSGGGYDADAQAFIDATGITDTTQKSAVNHLVLDLKSYNIWTELVAIYPIIGGTSSTHAVNLKTPGTYNLTFATGMTHSSTGMTGNGTTGYANTNFKFTDALNQNSNNYTIYVRTSRVGNTSNVMGSRQTTPATIQTWLQLRTSTNILQSTNNTSTASSISNSETKGFWQVNRTTSTGFVLFNNTTKNSFTNSSTGNASINHYLGARNNNGTADLYDTVEISFASMGNGLTDAEAANFYTAVQAFQTTLSRNV